MVIALVALLAFAGTASAAATTTTANPAFTVTVSASFFRHHITHVVRKRDETGCRWRTDIDTAERLTFTSHGSARMTLNDLVHGGNDFIGLDAREVRTGTYYVGWEAGCPLLDSQPPELSTTTACGKKKSFYVAQGETHVGYATPSSQNFRLMFSGPVPDPYGLNCLPEVYGGDTPGIEDIGVPPQVWQTGKTKRRWWTPVARAKLRTGKAVVVRWSSKGTINSTPTTDPAAYDQSVDTDSYTVSWTVTLRPTK